MDKAAVIVLKGDWSEFCSALGFPTWASSRDPCIFCHTQKEGLYSIRGFNAYEFPHAPKTDAEYAEACLRAEIRVLITADHHPEVVAALRFDKRKDGSHGRALIRDLPALGLRKNDRVEPSSGLRDVCLLDSATEFPIEVIFWRPSEQTWTTHRNPLFDPALGLGLGTLGVDTLHCLHLGVYKKCVAAVFWQLLLADAWSVADQAGGRRNQEELIANGISALKQELWNWYDAWERDHPGVPLNRVVDFNAHVLGEKDSCNLTTKAAETRPLVLFAAWIAEKKADRLPAEARDLVSAAGALARFSDLVRTCPTVAPARHLSGMVESLKLYVATSMRAGIQPTPKLHLALHLVQRTQIQSKPFLRNYRKAAGFQKFRSSFRFLSFKSNGNPFRPQDLAAGVACGCVDFR